MGDKPGRLPSAISFGREICGDLAAAERPYGGGGSDPAQARVLCGSGSSSVVCDAHAGQRPAYDIGDTCTADATPQRDAVLPHSVAADPRLLLRVADGGRVTLLGASFFQLYLSDPKCSGSETR